jgi:geranylgeranyl pyrophosphate synthase
VTQRGAGNGSAIPFQPPWLVDDMRRVENLLMSTAASSVHPLVSESSTHLIKAGGKRLRPALVVIASRAGEPARRATYQAAAGIELIHLASLYHDDVIDETETRRGVPTAHSKWGVEVAVLAGDFLFATGCALGAQAGGEVPLLIAGALAEVCEGQIVETESVGNPGRSVTEYFDTIRRKTAALFRASCELGVVTSGAAPSLRPALATFGEQLGIAFQLVDDLLDLFGDPEVTGKSPGTDLREGVFTMPVLVACERDPALVDMLTSGERSLDAVMPILSRTGAVDDAFAAAANHGKAARQALADLPESEWRGALDAIVDGVLRQIPSGSRATPT